MYRLEVYFRERQMKTGVKFCGGCNPTFDRGEAFNELKKRYPEVEFESYDAGKKYKRLILICGCERTCLRFREEFSADEILIPGSAEDMKKIKL